MIYLVTATPGSGKTLWTLDYFTKLAKSEDRQVYYSGILLTDEGKEETGWLELEEPEKWFELPAGAIIIIDECQRIFGRRPTGSKVPPHVSHFETHRHYGLDIVLITQGPNLLDSHIRPLVGKHIHLLRIFGSKSAQVLSWDGIQQNPNSQGAKTMCLDKRKFLHPKKVYSWYKSSEMHTHKLSIPKKFWMLIGCIILAVVCIWLAVHSLNGIGKPSKKDQTSVVGVPGQRGSGQQNQINESQIEKKPLTPQEWIDQRKPRIANRPESAPIYDEVAVVQTFPKLSACVQMADDCKCFTQQGTKIPVPKAKCEEYIVDGWFDPYRQDSQTQIAENVPTARMVSPPTIAQGGKRTFVIGERPTPKTEG